MHNPKTKNIDEYISLQPEDSVEGLEHIRRIIRSVAPDAEEVISYHMPGFRYHGMLVGFANWKQHYGFYPYNAHTLVEFAGELKGYQTSKGAIQFPKDKKLPVTLIKKIVKARIRENIEKEKRKKQKTK